MNKYDDLGQGQSWRVVQRVAKWRSFAAWLGWQVCRGMVIGLVGLLVGRGLAGLLMGSKW